MATYKNGIETRASLYLSSKRNFYEYGYNSASIKNIVTDANSLLVIFTYYFPSKESVAIGVLKDFVHDVTIALNEPLRDLYEANDILLIDMIEYRTYFKILASNKNIAKFYVEISSTQGYAEAVYNYKSYFLGRLLDRSRQYELTRDTKDDTYYNVVTSMIAGMETQFCRDISLERFTGDYNGAVDIFCNAYYPLIIKDEALLKEYNERAAAFVDRLSFKFSNDFSVNIKIKKEQ